MDIEEKKKIPIIVEDHINDQDLVTRYIGFYSNLDPKQCGLLNNLIWQVYKKEISWFDFLKKADELKLPEFREKIFPGILRYDFLAIADYLKLDILSVLDYLPDEYLADLVLVDLVGWLNNFITFFELTLSQEQKRLLVGFVSMYLQGEINNIDLLYLTTKEVEKGGVGLEGNIADRLVEEISIVVNDFQKTGILITAQPISVIEETPVVEQPVETTIIVDNTVAAQEIIKKSGLTINPDLHSRFTSIIVSGLKEVRKIIEVRERLMADTKIGGVGLKLEDAEIIINLISEEKKKRGMVQVVENKPKLLINTAPSEVLLPAAPEVKELEPPAPPINLPVVELPEKKPEFAKSVNLPITPVVPVVVKPPVQSVQIEKPKRTAPTTSDIKPIQASTIKIVPQEKAVPKVELSAQAPVQPKTPTTNAIPQTPAGRAKVDDVVYRTRLIGPIEELSGMDLVNFHRLSPKPRVAVDKIKSKIELLGGEGHAKKMQGVQAWQKSPLNQLYVAILNEGIKKIMPVKKIIEERQKNNLEVLTPDEFQEIMEFNRTLHY